MPSMENTIMHLPIDWVILGLVLALGAIGAMRTGTKHTAAFALAAPLAIVLQRMAADAAFLGSRINGIHAEYAGIIIYVVLFLLIIVLLYQIIPSDFSTGTYPLQGLLAGLSSAIVLSVVWPLIPGINAYTVLSPLVLNIFGAPYRLYWLLGAYGMLAFARR